MERVILNGKSETAIFLAYLLDKLPKAQRRHRLYVDVELKIDGEIVPFVPTVEDLSSNIDKLVTRKALEILSEAGLQPIADALRNARLTVGRAVKEAQERLRGKEEETVTKV